MILGWIGWLWKWMVRRFVVKIVLSSCVMKEIKIVVILCMSDVMVIIYLSIIMNI